ncbi:MAG: peptidoglycan-associated lipoprotein Pal [Nitrospiraceae bacterium]
MKRIVVKSGVVAVMGIVLLASQGCSKKWFQSSGESESGAASESANSNSKFPRISGGGSSGELSGFSQNPSEERLAQAQGGYTSSRTPSDSNARRRAGFISKEEKAQEMAALDAGLQDVFFGYDQWTLSNAGMEVLNQDARYLKDNPGSVLKIEGHCDERGTSEYNLVLGEKRAKAARSYLVEAGISSKQVATVSFGKERPFCFDRDESCYQQNRRGHMLLRTKK